MKRRFTRYNNILVSIMKRFTIFYFTILLLLLTASCGTLEIVEYQWDLTMESPYIPDNEYGIQLIADKDTLTSSKCIFHLENNSDKTIYFGTPFILETRINNQWYIVPCNEGIASNDPLYAVEPGEEFKYTDNFAILYGTLPKGTYRLIANYCFEKNSDDSFCVDCEFTID